jgi:hypothetical protein
MPSLALLESEISRLEAEKLQRRADGSFLSARL